MIKAWKHVLITALLLVAGASTVYAGQWKSDSNGWWYQNDNGSYPSNTWQQIGGRWYCFDGVGYMLHDTWAGDYYLGSDGAMLTNTTTPDGYDVGADGKWISRSSQKTLPLYEGEAGPFQKINGHYVYSGDVRGYDESRIKAEDDWTAGFYTSVSGTFYVDSNTRVAVKDSEFPANGKTADQWLDDYFARKKYWMILYIKVRGDHIEEIAAIDSIC